MNKLAQEHTSTANVNESILMKWPEEGRAGSTDGMMSAMQAKKQKNKKEINERSE